MEEFSSWDFVRSVLVDPDLEAHDVKRIYEGMVEQTDAFTRELVEMTDEELKGRVAELFGMCYEMSQPQLVPVARWLFQNTMTFRDVDNFYTDFVFANNLIPEEVLTFLVRADPELSVSETMVNLIKTNVYGSRQYAFERIHPYIDMANVSRGTITACIELARELGDDEAMGFMRHVYVTKFAGMVERMAVVGRVSREYYNRLLADECQALAIYRTKLEALRELGNVPIKAMNRARQLEVKSLLEKVSGMKELDEGAFDELCEDGLMGLRQVKFIELLNWIELNPVFRKLYGPYNPDRVIRQSVFGRGNSQLPEFPADPRRYFMHYRDQESEEASDWYTGFCDHCIREIPVRQRAFRTPIAEGGGWEGCFCSATCSVKHLLSGRAYSIPLEDLDERMDQLERQLRAFLAGEGFGFYEGLGFLVREFPVLLTSQEGDTEDRRGMRLPKIVVVPAREEKIAQSYSEDEQYREIVSSGQDLLQQLGLNPDDFGLLKDEGETIRYVKEIVLKRDHLETYALTMLMNKVYEAENIVVPPKK